MAKPEIRKYVFCIPEKVLIAFPTIEAEVMTLIPGYKKSFLLELLSLISINIQKNQTETHLQAEILKKLVPGYENYIRALIKYGVIRKYGNYIPGKCSFSYAFTESYKSRFKLFPVDDMFLIRRIQKNAPRKQYSRETGQTKLIQRIKISSEALEEIKYVDNIDEYNSALASILRIQQGYFRCKTDNTSGRFHSNLTNLPKYLRQYIRLDGEQLVNIDIKNSQPFLATILLTDPVKVSQFARSKQLSSLLKSLHRIDSKDAQLFALLASKGVIYEYLVQIGIAKERERAKRRMLVILYGPVCYKSKYHDIFERNFPEVYERFAIIKGVSKGSKFENFKRFSILLQKIESHLVLNVILHRLYKEYPGIKALTIHDSIMTSEKTYSIVKSVMKEELTKYIGYSPTLKVEELSTIHPDNYKAKIKQQKRVNHDLPTKNRFFSEKAPCNTLHINQIYGFQQQEAIMRYY